MMNPVDDLDVSPTHVVDCDASLATAAAAAAAPSTRERAMVFYRRPDVSGRPMLFHPRRASVSAAATKLEPMAAPPVQLLAMDGQTYFGIPAADAAGTSTGQSRSATASATGNAAVPSDGLARLLVTTDVVVDAQSKRRIRQLQLAMIAMAVAGVGLTAALLYPAGRDAWFNADAFGSAVGAANEQRVRALRPSLLALAVLINGFGVAAAFAHCEALLTLYIFALVSTDILSLLQLLPHAFFLVRFLFDLLLLLLAVETRGHLEHAWFVTNFHRLRY